MVPLRRVLGRLHAPGATVRLAVRGRRPVTGGIMRIRGDSVFVQRFGWPVGIPLASVDTVWQRVDGRNPTLKKGFIAGSMLGAVLGGAVLGRICTSGKGQNCGATAVAGAVGGGMALGGLGARLGSRGTQSTNWVRRHP